MAGFLRDTPTGQLLRAIGFKSWLPFPEEVSGYQPPAISTLSRVEPSIGSPDLEHNPSKVSATVDIATINVLEKGSQRRLTDNGSNDALIVSWYDHDQENPRNWSDRKKIWVMLVINLYTFVVYCTASIVTPGTSYIAAKYAVSETVASLILSMYVFGCKYSSIPRAIVHSNNL